MVTGICGLATYATGYARTIRVAESTDVVAIRPVGPPIGVEAHATGSGRITCYWRSVAGATGYNVYRGTVSSEEDYEHPVNGGVPWNTPSYSGSNVFAFTDTGLTNGTVYYYTVKAVRGYGESEPSDEDSDAPDPDAIPWDSRDAQAITTAVQSWAGFSADLVRAVGPDGTTYCNLYGVILPEGTIEPGTNILRLPSGAEVALSDDGGEFAEEPEAGVWEASVATRELNNSDGPYRRVKSTDEFTGSFGVFYPGWLNQISFGWGAWADTYWTYLGHHKKVGKMEADVDAGLQWSRVYESYNPYMSVKYRRTDSLPISRFTPINSPIRFDTSYGYGIEMSYALQRGGLWTMKYLPMLYAYGIDQDDADWRTVLLAAADSGGLSGPTAQMKRVHSIAQGKPPNNWRRTGSRFWGAEFYSGQLRDSSGNWVTWNSDRTAEQGCYPKYSDGIVKWTIPAGREYYEEKDIECDAR